MKDKNVKDTDTYVSTFSLHPRQKRYLEAMKKREGQNQSDTVRRALDEYMQRHPVAEVE